MQAFIVVKLILQIGLHVRIGGFRPQHIAVLGQIGRGSHAGSGAAEHGRTGLQAAHNQHEHKAHAADQQHTFPVPGHKGRGLFAFLGGFLGGCGGGLGGAGRALCRLARRPCCLGIVPFDFLFLPEPGHRVFHRLRHFRVVPQGFLVDVLRIGGNGLFLGLGCGPVGFELMTPDAAADGFSRLALGKFFPLMAALDAHILMLNLMDFSMQIQARFLHRTAGRVGFELGGRFLHLVKVQLGFGLAFGLVIDGFFGDDTFFRQGFFGCVQLIRPLFRLVNVLGKGGIGPFLGGELQAGRRAGGLRRRIRAIFGGPLRLAALPDVPGTFQHLFSGAARLGCGIVLFGLPAGNVDALAGGLVIQRQAVAGHVLRHLVTGFQLLHRASPPCLSYRFALA